MIHEWARPACIRVPGGWGSRFCSGLGLCGRHLVSAAEVKEVVGKSATTTAGGGEGGPGGGDSRRPRRRGGGGGEGGGWRPGLASAPRGVGGGTTRGTGIGNKRPFSAPWPGQGFREALEEPGSALGQAVVGMGGGDSDTRDLWGGGQILGRGRRFPSWTSPPAPKSDLGVRPPRIWFWRLRPSIPSQGPGPCPEPCIASQNAPQSPVETYGIDIPGRSPPPMYAIKALPQNLPSDPPSPSVFALTAFKRG